MVKIDILKKIAITYPDDPTNSQYFWTQSSKDFQNIWTTMFDGKILKYQLRSSFVIWIVHNQMGSLNNHPLHMSPKFLQFLLQLQLFLCLVRKWLELAFHLKKYIGYTLITTNLVTMKPLRLWESIYSFKHMYEEIILVTIRDSEKIGTS